MGSAGKIIEFSLSSFFPQKYQKNPQIQSAVRVFNFFHFFFFFVSLLLRLSLFDNSGIIMRKTVKRESEAPGGSGGKREADDEPERLRSVKKEKQRKTGADFVRPDEPPPTQEEEQGISDRRILRSKYLSLQNEINGTISVSYSLFITYVH